MGKITKSFRLSRRTLEQIEWLAFFLGDITATDVITLAVAELYERKRGEFPVVQLIPQQGGHYDLQVQGKTVLRLSEDTLSYLPDEVRADLLSGRAQLGDALVHLVLSAARSGDKLGIDRTTLADALDLSTR